MRNRVSSVFISIQICGAWMFNVLSSKNYKFFIFKPIAAFALIWAFIALCFSCAGKKDGHLAKRQQWMQPNGKIKVLSTIAMIDDMVKNVGGEHVDSYTLIRGELDPHSYTLVKGDDETLAFADIVFFNGLGLEHGPSLQGFLTNSKKAIGLGDKVRAFDPSLILIEKGQIDPHIWMDISLWAKTVPFIVQTLSDADPKHKEDYEKNGQKLVHELMKAHEEVKKELQSIPESQRYLVSSHDAFNYFTRSYLSEDQELANDIWKKRVAAPEGLAPESQLSVSDIQKIISHLKEYQIHVLFPESNVSKDSIRKIVQAGSEKGLKLSVACVYLYADAMGAPGSEGDTYLKMIVHNAKSIAEYLRNNISEKDCSAD